MFLILGSLIACSTQEESSKDQIIVVPKHVASRKDDFEKKSFYCCSDASIQPLMESYLKLIETLTIRSTLSDISLQMIDLAKQQKMDKGVNDKGVKMAIAFCPMAPGRWLQTRTEIHNPYYGSQMLKCGVFE